MNKEEKIEATANDEKIFLNADTSRYEYYVVRGVNRSVYDVLYFKGLDKWKCDCDNVRTTPCYHILAVKKFKNDNSEINNKDTDDCVVGINGYVVNS